MKRVNPNVYLCALLLFCQQAVADDEQPQQPSMELLEFLGSGENIDGQWLDPLHMVELDSQDLADKQQEERKHE